MKKIKVFGMMLAFILTSVCLVACEFTNNPVETYTPGITATEQTINLNVGDKLDLLTGVKAINNKGVSFLDDVEVSHNIPVDANGCVTTSGDYSVKYIVTIDSVKYNMYRTVTVHYVAPVTDDLVINGDFETGSVDPYTKSTFDNGSANLKVVSEGDNKVLAVEVTAVSWQASSPRVETNKFSLEVGKFYQASFKAKALAAKTIYVQIGELLDSDPWFNQIGEAHFDLTTEYQTFNFNFEAATTADLSKIQLLFGFGKQVDGQSIATTCYFDDIKVEQYTPKSLLSMNSLESFGGEDDAKAHPGVGYVWNVQDASWGCGPVTEVTSSFEAGVLKIAAKQPADAVHYGVQFFLYSDAVEKDGVYKTTLSIHSNKAAAITVNGVVVNLVEGDNPVAVESELVAGKQIGLSVQFGVATGSACGDIEVQVSNIVSTRTGDIVHIDFADASNLFGTPATDAKNGGKDDALAAANTFNVWYVQDASWNCGPIANASYELTNGVLKIKATLNETHWWFAVQAFYATKPIKEAGSHTFTFVLKSNVAGTITICGVKTNIVVGENKINIPFTVGAGESFLFSVQLGWEEIVEGSDNKSHQLLGASELEMSEFSIDGQKYTGTTENPNPDPDPDPDPIEGEKLIVVNDAGHSTHIDGAGVMLYFDNSTLALKNVADASQMVQVGVKTSTENPAFQAYITGGPNAIQVATIAIDSCDNATGRIFIVLNAGVPSNIEFYHEFVVTVKVGEKEYQATVNFKGNAYVDPNATPEPDPEPTPEPTETKPLVVLTTDPTTSKIEGAGVWVYFDNTELKITPNTQAIVTVTVKGTTDNEAYKAYAEGGSNAVTVASYQFDSYADTTCRLLVILTAGLPNDINFQHEVVVTIQIGTIAYTATLHFLNNAYVA